MRERDDDAIGFKRLPEHQQQVAADQVLAVIDAFHPEFDKDVDAGDEIRRDLLQPEAETDTQRPAENRQCRQAASAPGVLGSRVRNRISAMMPTFSTFQAIPFRKAA
ncbi:MAG: hypothetical protein ACI9JL_002368 [Paracoccaceae bacterium]